MSTEYKVGVPYEDRFEAMPDDRSAVRMWAEPPPRFDFRSAPAPLSIARTTVAAAGHLYVSPRIGWRGVVYSTDADRERVETLLRVGEGVVLFFAWLKKQHTCARRGCGHPADEHVAEGQGIGAGRPRLRRIDIPVDFVADRSVPIVCSS
jgi:hypothetical protein